MGTLEGFSCKWKLMGVAKSATFLVALITVVGIFRGWTTTSPNEGRATYFFKGKHYWKFDTSTGVLQSADQGTEYGADEGHFRGIPVAPDAAFTTCGSRVGACAFDNQEAEVLPYL